MSGGSGLSDDHTDAPRDAGRVLKEIAHAKDEWEHAKKKLRDATSEENSISCRLRNLQSELTKLVITDLDVSLLRKHI